MTAAKNVYALMLALVIVLSGCFGNTADDTDAQDATDSTESSEMNQPPIVYRKISYQDWEERTYNQTTGDEREKTNCSRSNNNRACKIG